MFSASVFIFSKYNRFLAKVYFEKIEAVIRRGGL